MKSFTMKLTKFLFGTSLVLLLFTQLTIEVSAQTRNPFREYTNPDEIVTFDRSTSYTSISLLRNMKTNLLLIYPVIPVL